MDEKEQIAFGNLQGRVAFLEAMVRMLCERLMPFEPSTGQHINAALNRVRAGLPEASPDRISFEHAVNTAQPWTWTVKK